MPLPPRKPPVKPPDMPKPPDLLSAIQLARIADLLEEHLPTISASLECLCRSATPEATHITDWELVQLDKENNEMGSITGVAPGTTQAFHILPVPGNGAPGATPPVATSSNPNVTVAASRNEPDNPYAIEVSLAEGETGESFDLSVDGPNDKGDTISHTFVIPVLAGPAPSIVDWDLEQLAINPLPGGGGLGGRAPARGGRPSAQTVRPGGGRR